MANDKLTKQQEIFVQELLKNKSQRQAYKIAYPKSIKWADEAVDVQASQLLNKNSKVLVRYNELSDRLKKESEDECIVEAKDVLKELKNIAFDDMKNYLEFKTEKTVAEYDNENNPILKYETIIDLKNSSDIDTRNISEISKGRDGTFKFKLNDKQKALENIARMLGMFNDSLKVDITKSINETIIEIEEFMNDYDNEK